MNRANHPGADTAVVLELPAAQAASLGQWLRCAAVVFEICANGVRIDMRGNRVFAYADVATLVREWMQAQMSRFPRPARFPAHIDVPHSRRSSVASWQRSWRFVMR